MCQLTYSNLHDPYLNGLMIYLLSMIGSERHDDGCGIIMSDNSIWKTKHAAKNIKNMGSLLFEFITNDNAVPFHIRSATWGIEVTDENAHPFDGKHFILMHNGTLIPKNGEEPKDKKKDSDSLNFLNSLDASKDKSGDDSFENIFNNTMKEFSGKFAFIIRNKDTKTDYIIRGKTAELWISYLSLGEKRVGYVVNTSDITMKEAFRHFRNFSGLISGVEYNISDPKLLEQETIFIGEKDDIRSVGKTTETSPIKAIEVVEKGYTKTKRKTSLMSSDNYGNSSDIFKVALRIYKYLDEHSLSLLDFQMILYIISGISILEVTMEDLNMFIEYLIPKISSENSIKKFVNKSVNNQYFPNEVIKKCNLEYPWPLNKPEVIKKALQEYNK